MRTRPFLLALLLCGIAIVMLIHGNGSGAVVEAAQNPTGAATARVLDAAPASVTPTSTGLRYDGLYRYVEQDGIEWLRFYEDGTVLDVSTNEETPSQVAEWFNTDSSSTSFSTGVYTVQGSLLSFSTTSWYGTVDYAGTIGGDTLTLKWHSHINDNRDTYIYKWVSIAPKSAMPDATPSPTFESEPGVVLYLARGETQVLTKKPRGAGRFYFFESGVRDFRYSLAGDIQGASYVFDLWLASWTTTTFTASILVRQSGRETVLASAFFTVDQSYDYQRFSATVSGLDPTTTAGDTLILRVSCSSDLQGISTSLGGLAYGGGTTSYIIIPPVK